MKPQEEIHTLQTLARECEVFWERDLPTAGYRLFWETINTQPNKSTNYLVCLLSECFLFHTGKNKKLTCQQFVDLLNDQKDTLNAKSRYPTLPQDCKDHILKAISTCFFVAMFFPFDQTNVPLCNIISIYKRLRKKAIKSEPLNDEMEMLDELLNILSTQNPFKEPESIEFLIHLHATIPFPTSNIHEISPKLGTLSLVKSFFDQNMSDPKISDIIISSILTLLKNPNSTDSSILQLLILLKDLYVKWHQPNPTGVQEAIEIVKQFYVYPRPISDYAHEFLELTLNESMCVGHIRRENIINSCNLSSTQNNVGLDIYFLCDITLDSANSFQKVYSTHTPSPITLADIHAKLLSNTLLKVLDIPVSSQKIEYLSPQDLLKFSIEAYNIESKALKMNPQIASTYFKEELLHLNQQIQSSLTKEKHYNGSLEEQLIPPSMNAKFEFVEHPQFQTPKIVSKANVANEASSPPVSMSPANTQNNFPELAQYKILNSIIEENMKNSQNQNNLVIRIGIVGNDITLNCVAGSFAQFKLTHAQLLNNVDILFYYFPEADSDLASLLVSRDLCFARSVVGIQNMIFGVYPQCRISDRSLSVMPDLPSKSQTSKSNKLGITPSYIFRNEMEDFIRSANWPLNLNLYRCTYWTKKNTEPIIRFFCLRVEIGLLACCSGFRKKKKNKDKDKDILKLSDEDITKEKGFKFNAPSLQFKFTLMNLYGDERQGPKLENKSYVQVSISSIPKSTDKGVKSYPTRPWLEMWLNEADKKKTSMEGRTFHVGSVEIEGSSFDLAIDGDYCGTCDKIKISPVLDSTEYPLQLPLMTFLPHPDEALH